jgi:hypothetical protein
LWGLLAPTPLGFNPLPKRLTPTEYAHVIRNAYDHV